MTTNTAVTGMMMTSPMNPTPYQWWNYPIVQQTPHKCPVCEGRQQVAEGFYEDDPPFPYYEPLRCRTCWGTGVLWR